MIEKKKSIGFTDLNPVPEEEANKLSSHKVSIKNSEKIISEVNIIDQAKQPELTP